MTNQPPPPKTRQSTPPAKGADMDALHNLTPGGPIMPRPQPDGKPNPTDRGREANTEMHRGTPNPEQRGSDIRHGDHNPGYGESGNVSRSHRGIPSVTADVSLKHSAKGTKVPPPPPDPRGVRK